MGVRVTASVASGCSYSDMFCYSLLWYLPHCISNAYLITHIHMHLCINTQLIMFVCLGNQWMKVTLGKSFPCWGSVSSSLNVGLRLNWSCIYSANSKEWLLGGLCSGPSHRGIRTPFPPSVETIYLPLACSYHFPGSQTVWPGSILSTKCTGCHPS